MLWERLDLDQYGQRGSHVILEGPQGRYTVVPRHDEIALSTLLKILAEADLTREEFLNLL